MVARRTILPLVLMVTACEPPLASAPEQPAPEPREGEAPAPEEVESPAQGDGLWPPLEPGQTSCHLRLRSREVCDTPGWVRSPGIGPSILSLAAFSDTEIWAVDESGALLFWDGVAFGGGLREDGRAYRWVWGLGPDDVWAVGDDGLVSHWDGDTLTDLQTPGTEDLRKVHGSASDDVWFVTTEGLLHWDGGSFTAMRMPGDEPDVSDVLAFSKDDAWAVGEGLFRWDGTQWRATPATFDSYECSRSTDWCGTITRYVRGSRIVGTSSESVWVGSLHWNGSVWVDTMDLIFLDRILALTLSGDHVFMIVEAASGDMSTTLMLKRPGRSDVWDPPRVTALATLPDGRIVGGVGAHLSWFADDEWSEEEHVRISYEAPPAAYSPARDLGGAEGDVALVRSESGWTPAWHSFRDASITSDLEDGAWANIHLALWHLTTGGLRAVPRLPCVGDHVPLPDEEVALLCDPWYGESRKVHVLQGKAWRELPVPGKPKGPLRTNARGTLLLHDRDGSLLVRKEQRWTRIAAPPQSTNSTHLFEDGGIVGLREDKAWVWRPSGWKVLQLPAKAGDVSGSGLDDLVFTPSRWMSGSPNSWHWDGRRFTRVRFERMHYVAGEWLAVNHGSLLQHRSAP